MLSERSYPVNLKLCVILTVKISNTKIFFFTLTCTQRRPFTDVFFAVVVVVVFFFFGGGTHL